MNGAESAGATAGQQRRVLVLSGPVEPPWNRSDKNLVRGVATHLQRYRPRVLTHEGSVGALPAHVATEPAWGPNDGNSTALSRRVGLLRQLVKQTDADLVHLCWPADLFVASAVRAACAARGLPALHTLVRAPRTTLAIHRTVAAQPVVCLSQETQRRVQRDGIADAVWIPPGVTVPEPTPPERLRTLRARHGLPHGAPLVIYAGDYTHAYAARTVAATLPRVVREVPAHFVMACRIRGQRDRDEEARIRAAVVADGMADHISFLNEVDDLGALLEVADVQIFPADSANQRLDMPMVLLEGLARGTATVVANKAPFEELVEPGAAIGVPSVNPVSLAVAIVELLRDDERRLALAARGRAVVAERFDIRRVAEAYESLYDRVLDDTAAQRRKRQGSGLLSSSFRIMATTAREGGRP